MGDLGVHTGNSPCVRTHVYLPGESSIEALGMNEHNEGISDTHSRHNNNIIASDGVTRGSVTDADETFYTTNERMVEPFGSLTSPATAGGTSDVSTNTKGGEPIESQDDDVVAVSCILSLAKKSEAPQTAAATVAVGMANEANLAAKRTTPEPDKTKPQVRKPRRRVLLPTQKIPPNPKRSKTQHKAQKRNTKTKPSAEHPKGSISVQLDTEQTKVLREEQQDAASSLILMMQQSQQYAVAYSHLQMMYQQEDKGKRKVANSLVNSLLQQQQNTELQQHRQQQLITEAQSRTEAWLRGAQMQEKASVPSLMEVAHSIIKQSATEKTKLITCSDNARWDLRVQEVKAFVMEHGHGRIPTQYKANPALANWCKRQRYHYKVYLKNLKEFTTHGKGAKRLKCHMTPERAKTLNDVGFCWDLQAGGWDHSYEQLKKCRSPPNKYTNYELWKWMGTQRYQMSLLKRGKTTYLNPDRIRKLNAIGFVWSETDEISDG